MPRVLVAEPSGPISAALRKFLDGAAEVVIARFIDEAMQAVRARPPDVLIASVSGSFDGEVLCTQVLKQGNDTAVVLVYPAEEEHPQDRAQAMGADAFLVGPLKKAAVLNALNTVLQLKALRLRVLELEALVGRLKTLPPPAPPPPPAPKPVKLPVARSEDESFFKKYLLLEIKRSRRYQYPVALMMMELDGLAQALAAGTSPEFQRAAIRAEVLKVMGTVLRDIDLAVPFADDKYLVFLPHTPRSGCTVVAERIVKRLAKTDHFSGGVSIGVASYDPRLTPKASVSFGALVRDARGALKKAQAAGGGRVELAAHSTPVKRNRISMG